MLIEPLLSSRSEPAELGNLPEVSQLSITGAGLGPRGSDSQKRALRGILINLTTHPPSLLSFNIVIIYVKELVSKFKEHTV